MGQQAIKKKWHAWFCRLSFFQKFPPGGPTKCRTLCFFMNHRIHQWIHQGIYQYICQWIHQWMHQRMHQWIRQWIHQWIRQWIHQWIRQWIHRWIKHQPQHQPQQNRNLQRGAARFSAPPPFVGAAAKGRRSYFGGLLSDRVSWTNKMNQTAA